MRRVAEPETQALACIPVRHDNSSYLPLVLVSDKAQAGYRDSRRGTRSLLRYSRHNILRSRTDESYFIVSVLRCYVISASIIHMHKKQVSIACR